MRSFIFLFFIIAVAFISFFEKKEIPDSFDLKLTRKAQSVILSSKLTTNKYQRGTVSAEFDNYKLTENKINQQVALDTHKKPQRTAYILQWRDRLNNVIALSALGLDYKHHFASSFLVGIRPFPVKNKWLPLYTISKLKTYELDSKQYNVTEMWQNSAQAYMMPRGDCEDHAIALADWLISEGVDARVAGGKYKTGGHAWVVAIINHKEFILEATNKRVGKSWKNFPLASLATNYHPTFMFNRTDFWVNTDKNIKDNYRGAHWKKTSTFKKDHKIAPKKQTTASAQ